MAICPTCQGSIEDGASECPIDGTKLISDSKIGSVLGDRYRLVAKLGQGGMGTVYLAEHVVLGKNMAVKVLREELSRDEELVKRFQQEAVAASRIGHENIVNVTDFGRSPEGALYFVMEYLEGQSLTRLIRQGGPMPLERAVPILAQICRALAAAHSRGIVHRDLKPDNVMVVRREDGSDLVKVLDFGISKVHTGNASDSGRLTRVGMVMGTPEYMAPEQVEASSVDHRVDIYSLGAVAYELVTGKLPFEANTPVAMLMKHQSEPLVPIRTRRPDLNLPDALDRLIVKAMSKRPAERQQSMQEVLSELAAIGAQIGSAPIFTPVPGSIVLDALAMPSANDERPTPSPPVAEPDVAFAPTTVRPTPADLAVPRDTVLGRTPLPSAAAEAVAPADDVESLAIKRGPSRAVIGVAAALVLLVLGIVGFRAALAGDPAATPTPESPVEPTMPAAAAVPVEPAKPAEPPPPALKEVRITSVPAGATVWTRSGEVGKTPLTVKLADGEAAEYRFTLKGYKPATRRISAGDGAVEVKLQKRTRTAPAEQDEGFGKFDDFKELE